MNTAQTNEKYEQLRQELASAYAEDLWDSQRIDQIADELAKLDQILAASAARARRLRRFEAEQPRPQDLLL